MAIPKLELDCSLCGAPLTKMYFTEHEYVDGVPTGRKRTAVSKLICTRCLHEEICDDSFDGEWY